MAIFGTSENKEGLFSTLRKDNNELQSAHSQLNTQLKKLDVELI